MKLLNLQAIYPKKCLSKGDPNHQKYPYLLRDLSINRPNHVWCTDITYIKMSKGFTYLMAIIDVYSRRIVSWGLSTSMDKEFCLDVLKKGILHATPDYLNSDQGCQFTSNDWIETVRNADIKVSHDGIGRQHCFIKF